MLDKSAAPYFDTFNEDKKYYQVLFRPSYAIQTRELNELQTQLQNQIARFGSHVFKEGSMVIPGTLTISARNTNSTVNYVKLESSYLGVDIESYIEDIVNGDAILTGDVTGVQAKIIHYEAATESDPVTIYVRYLSSGTDNETKVFQAGETIFNDVEPSKGFVVAAETSTPIGLSAVANIQRGVYYIQGKFVLVENQTISLSKYSDVPTCKVGLFLNESFVTPEQDISLFDNANGSTNYAAPGAHRYFVDLILTSVDLDYASPNFIELASVEDGTIKALVDNSQYAVLGETLARRTYDESGNYTVTAFPIEVREHRSNERGEFQANTRYELGDVVTSGVNTYVVDVAGTSSLSAPAHTSGSIANGGVLFTFEPNPSYNSGVYASGDSTKVAAGIGAGKAYVFGYESVNQSTRYLDVNKASDFNVVRSAAIPVNIGQYVKTTDNFGSLDVTSFPRVAIYSGYVTVGGTASGSIVGYANAGYMEYDTGTIGSDAKYVLSLFNITMNSGKSFVDHARSIFFDNPIGVDFTANIEKKLTSLTGTITVAAASANITGVGTKFTSELNVGQAIGWYNGSTLKTGIVQTINSDTALVLTAVAGDTQSNVNPSRLTSKIYSEGTMGLLGTIPNSFVRKVRDIDNEAISNLSYYGRSKFSGTASSNQIVISNALAGETFASVSQPDSFIVINTTTGAYINPTITLSAGATTATIVGLVNGNTYDVIATTRRTVVEKKKTLSRWVTEDFTTESVVKTSKITLGKVDGLKLRKVEYFTTSAGAIVPFGSPIPADAVAHDITNQYVFDNGQTPMYYGLSSVTRKAGSGYPASPIRVTYDCFDRSSTGDYFTVDSYSGLAVSVPTLQNGASLTDVIDFRPDQTGTNSFANSRYPALGFDVITDYSYFLPRKDVIYVTSNGMFGVEYGVSSNDLPEPKIPSNGMILFKLISYPYSSKPIVETVDNRRYTMRDIGNIEKRLKNVEYYTALSALESQTNNLQLFDTDGNLNFKNGFIVDPFNDQSIADTASSEFIASIDPIRKELRPSYAIDNIKMVEVLSTDAQRTSAKYSNKSDIITLDYTESAYINQPFATRPESITPFLQLNFIGSVDLTPSSDEWYETAYAPNVVIQREGNFSALAANSNLGTVWGNWQVSWGGWSTTTTGGWGGWNALGSFDSWNNIGTTTTTTSRSGTQTRAGTETFITAVFDTQVIDDRVISVDFIPFMRSRDILFVGKALKPFTRVYAYFDQVPVGEFVSYSTKITLNAKNGAFNTTTSSGSGSEATARQTTGVVGATLSTGDILHNGSGGVLANATATGVVVIDEDDSVTIVNRKGTFGVGQTVYGTISGATGTVGSVTNYTTLITNQYGEVAGIFRVPSNARTRFATGQRVFTLTDSVKNADDYTTRATENFTSIGHLSTRQQTILSTRNGVVSTRRVSQSQNISESSTVVTQTPGFGGGGDGGGDGGDPLAQSFMIENNDGVFVTSVDVYFAGKDRSVSCWFYLCEMNAGVPTTNVVPGSRVVLRPKDVVTSSNSSVATKIKFPYPIYLSGDTEYAFVLGSDSSFYSVWVSQLGENDILTNQRIARQPYLGSVFKSQNARSWNPDQLQDIKFKVNRAKFQTGSANVQFQNLKLGTFALPYSPVQTKSGSNKVRFNIPNHGLVIGSKFTVSGLIDTNGIVAANLNKQHTVESFEIDYVQVTVASNATITGFGGGSSGVVTKNVPMDVCNVIATQFAVEGTSIKHFVRPSNTSLVIQSEGVEVPTGEDVTFQSPMVIASEENQVNGKSLISYVQLTSASDFVSPVLDIQRYSIAAITNKINYPTTSMNISVLDDNTLGTSSSISFSGSQMLTATANATFKLVKVGRYVTISGSASNNGTFLVTAVATDGSSVTFDKSFTTEGTGASITLTQKERYVDEFAPVAGSAEAKYLVKEMTLTLPAKLLTVYFDVSKPSVADVQLYYRVISDSSKIEDKTWTKATPDVAISSSENKAAFFGAVYNISNPTEFTKAQIKLVMNSTDTSRVPIIKNLRMIAMT